MDGQSTFVLTDAELLTRYAGGGDPFAFAELVGRYQPMVLRVCRHMLGGGQQAEDASQQVFLALSMKAATLTGRETIASWLYRAAWNIASRTRRAACVRKAHEKSAASRMPMYAPIKNTEPDTLIILHEALAEMPEIYREAIVLHYFCGYSVAESAAKLRCPVGTVAARVSRGLERMREILAGRSLVLGVVGLRLLMLEMAPKASATVVAPSASAVLANVPRLGVGQLFRARILRAARLAGLLPVGFALPAWGALLSGVSNLPSPTRAAKSLVVPKLTFWTIFNIVGQSKPKQAALSVLLGISCMGAGTAAAKIIAPGSWLANLPATLANQIERAPAPKADVEVKAAHKALLDSQVVEQIDRPSYGSSDHDSSVPEPASMSVMILTGTLALARRRRR